jgi:hypothetical protein
VGGIKKYKRIEEHIRDLLDAFTTINESFKILSAVFW